MDEKIVKHMQISEVDRPHQYNADKKVIISIHIETHFIEFSNPLS